MSVEGEKSGQHGSFFVNSCSYDVNGFICVEHYGVLTGEMDLKRDNSRFLMMDG
jgi:hypothetical protein